MDWFFSGRLHLFIKYIFSILYVILIKLFFQVFDVDTKDMSGGVGQDPPNNHPANKFVMDLIRFIIFDSLSLPVSAKTTPPLDIVLEVIFIQILPNIIYL